jgi:biotin transport system substrate-specific component
MTEQKKETETLLPVKETRKPKAHLIARAGVFVAIVAVSAQIAFPLPGTLVPVTLQTLAVILCAVSLPPLYTLAAVVSYVVIGLCGVPVFAGFKGTAAIAGPTGGFIVGFLPSAVLVSLCVHFIEKYVRKKALRYTLFAASLVLFTVVLYAFGLLVFCLVTQKTVFEAFLLCAVPFLPGDAVKCVLACLAYAPLVRLRKK